MSEIWGGMELPQKFLIRLASDHEDLLPLRQGRTLLFNLTINGCFGIGYVFHLASMK